MTLKQSKRVQAICALVIIIHHISLKLCDTGSVPAEYIRHGLEPFMYVGYLAVAFFFFCSGYGLYKSLKEKEDYFKDFLFNRLTPILIVHFLISFIYIFITNLQNIPISFNSPFTLFGPNTANPYSWYIYTIILCYILFKLAFKYVKNDNISIMIIIVGELLYILFCNYWLYGGWWYNTILIFSIGILWAKNEEWIQKKISDYYKQCLAIALALFVVGFAGSEALTSFLTKSDYLMGYSIGQLILALIRTIASFGFVWLIVLIAGRVNKENKVLDFLGGLTLEIYLVHGIFVQIFASEYLAGYNISVCYIPNQFLYIGLVLVLTLISAYLLYWIKVLLFTWIKKELKGLYGKSIRIAALILVAVFIFLTIKTYIEDKNTMSERSKEYTRFCEEQNYVETSNGRMAYFVQGEGEHTIVILGSINDPSSELVMRYLSKFISKENRVLIFDYLGRGFSDDSVTERTALNIANELHEALESLNLSDKYILMPCDYSGLYALKYIEMYPEKIEGLIGIDMMLPTQYEVIVKNSGIGEAAYDEAMDKTYKYKDFWRRFEAKSGYSRWIFHVYESLWMTPSLKDYIDIIEEVYVKNIHRNTVIEEQRLAGSNSKQINMVQLPKDFPTLMVTDYATSRAKIGKINYISTYYDFISNPDIQRVRIVQGEPFFMYYQGKYFSQMINEYLHTNF